MNPQDSLRTDDIEETIQQIEERIKKAEPKVDMIFLETGRGNQTTEHEPIPENIG